MTLTIHGLTLELNGHHFYASSAGGRGLFLQFRTGAPLWDFERRTAGCSSSGSAGVEVWGLGMHLVIDGKATGAALGQA
ncbi:hypothetical protein GCM10022279_25480 [Comamonas faecalis]|uniref:Uncharacterized protein n=1 Tax=Comamonas faecalis TaxID=1387849 RepID=A0ABP7RQ63_9BURK